MQSGTSVMDRGLLLESKVKFLLHVCQLFTYVNHCDAAAAWCHHVRNLFQRRSPVPLTWK